MGLYGLLCNVRERIADGYAADCYANAMQDDRFASRVFKRPPGWSCHHPVHLLRPAWRATGKHGAICEANDFHLIAVPK
ncbi:MAG TPA: hypothetical protein DCO71_05555 [Gammaproteobacteria bacterium]|nr:hypothetical protein [Gammaproteobacteria bacterium]